MENAEPYDEELCARISARGAIDDDHRDAIEESYSTPRGAQVKRKALTLVQEEGEPTSEEEADGVAAVARRSRTASSTRRRQWCFTINDLGSSLRLPEYDPSVHKFIVWQYEEAPETRHVHIQGYVEFTSPRTFGGVQRMLPGAHIEPARGSPYQNYEYCTKRRTRAEHLPGPFVYGDVPENPGDTRRAVKKARCQHIYDMVKAGATDLEVADQAKAVWEIKAAQQYRQLLLRPRDMKVPPVIIWCWGPTATGKTYFATHIDPDSFYICRNWENLSGYRQQNVFILDDLRPGKIPFVDLLTILDRYPLLMNVKFGDVQLNSKVICVTSCLAPNDGAWAVTNEQLDQLTRRVTHVFPFATSQYDFSLDPPMPYPTCPYVKIIHGEVRMVLTSTGVEVTQPTQQDVITIN